MLIEEYDSLFKRTLQGRMEFRGFAAEPQNVAMLRDALKMLDDEVRKLKYLERLKDRGYPIIGFLPPVKIQYSLYQ